jgi:hypothetical protein
MGAEQLNSKRVETKVKKPFPVLLTGIVFILVIAVSILRIYFSKIIETPTLSLQEEQRKLFYYPYLPENLARPVPDRLPRPPYNSKMQ